MATNSVTAPSATQKSSVKASQQKQMVPGQYNEVNLSTCNHGQFNNGSSSHDLKAGNLELSSKKSQTPDAAQVFRHKEYGPLHGKQQTSDDPLLQSTRTQLSTSHDEFPASKNTNFPGVCDIKPRKMTIVAANFGGTIYHEGEDAWGIYHPIGDTGTITNPFSPDLQHFSVNTNVKDADYQDEKHTRVLNSAGKFGLAAGKAYIDVSISCRKIMSGFWFKERFFITCAQFMDDLPDNAPSKENLVKNLKISGARIATSFYSSDRDKESRMVRLLKALHDEDLAVFQLNEGEPNPRYYVREDQLHSITDYPISTPTIFTAAYNGMDMPVDQAPMEDRDKTSGLAKKHGASVFKYLRAQHEAKLQLNDYKAYRSLMSTPNETDPSFYDFYQPNFRALAVGKLIPCTDEENAADDRQYNLGLTSLAHVRRHTISGFFGCSGAMVAIPGQDVDSWKVIGLFKGNGDLLPFNRFVALSQQGIYYLQKITEAPLNATSEAASLVTLLGDLDINNPDTNMIASPFVAQKSADASEATGSGVGGKASACQRPDANDNEDEGVIVVGSAKAKASD